MPPPDRRGGDPVRDRAGLHALEGALESGDLLFQAFTNSRLAFCITDPKREDNPIVLANDAFLDLTGYSRDDVVGVNCRFLQGPGTTAESVAEIRSALAERRTTTVEVVNYRKDGTRFVNALQVGPIFDRDGGLAYFFGSQIDVTERRRVEAETRALASRELRHRLMNIVNVLGILVRNMGREQPGLEEPTARIETLIRSVGQAHLLALGAEDEQPPPFRQIAETILQAYAPGGRPSVVLDGPEVRVGPAQLTLIAAILHELATNAVKHGCLGHPAGRVTLEWTVEREGGVDCLSFRWRETGGGPVAPPTRESGSRMIADLVRLAKGRLDYHWLPEGLTVEGRLRLTGG